MSSHIDPLIFQKLTAFAKRRRGLIILRGVLAAVAVLIAAMVAVAAADYYIPFLSDKSRWVLSLLAYAASFAVAWWYCLRPLRHAPNERQIARLLEHAAPKLREDLLSAVELGSGEGDVFDSAQFRELLQKDVSSRMEDVEVEALLPVTLIKRYINFAGVIIVALVVLMLASQMRLSSLLLRAFAPGANLARVSNTQIVIVEPKEGDQIVAQGDAVKVVIQLKGVVVQTANLETVSKGEPSTISEMTPIGNDRFTANIRVGRNTVDYRIQAGDGRSRYYHLTAAARPIEEGFEMTYHYPGYTGIADKTVKDESGDIAAIVGTKVDVIVKPNQPVKSGALNMDIGGKQVLVPLNQLPDGCLSTQLTIKESATYRVNLTSKDTGFENKFGPAYELRAAPDLVPAITLVEPENDLISPANEIVKIIANASDDIGLAQVTQEIKVNDGKWKEVVLAKNAGPSKRVTRDWDLFEEGVREGDQISMKLVAADFAGNRVESRTLLITVVAAGFEMKRLSAIRDFQALNAAFQALLASSEKLEAQTKVASGRFDTMEPTDSLRGQTVQSLVAVYEDYEAKLRQDAIRREAH